MTDPTHPPSNNAGSLHAAGAEPAFVARRRELEQLCSGLRDVKKGRGRLFVLTGEPGIGKTRLADELARKALEEGARVVWGRCWESGGAPPYWPWHQVIRACVEGGDALSVLDVSSSAILDLIPPHLRWQVTSSDRSPGRAMLAPVTSAEPELERFRMFDCLARFLKYIAEATPLVVILDDCHSADEASLIFLRFLARDLRHTRILLLVTYREIEAKLMPPLAELLGELSREGAVITLHGMGQAEVSEFLELNTGHKPEPSTVTALYRTTEGNPFFLSQIVRLLTTERRFQKPHLRELENFEIPNEVRVAIRRQFQLVSEPVRNLLRLASVVGRDFDLAVIRAISGLATEPLVDTLNEATSAGLLNELQGAIGRYRFSHSLIRETLYEDLPRLRRPKLHQSVAVAIEQLYESNLEAHLQELAYHYVEALPFGQVEKAVEYACRGAQRAGSLQAYEDCANLYQMALKALELQPDATDNARYDILVGMGDAFYGAGLFGRSREAFDRAMSLARCAANAELFARAVLGFGRLPSDAGRVDQALVAMLEEALAALGANDSQLRAMIMARLASELYWSSAEAQRAALSRDAIQIARRVGDVATLIYVLYSMHVASWGPDNLDERLQTAAEIERLADQSGNKLWALRARYLRIVDLLELGDVKAAHEELETYSQLADELHLQFGIREQALATRALMDGRFEDGERLAREALAVGERLERRAKTSRQAFTAYLLALRQQQGRLGELKSLIETLARISSRVVFARCAVAFYDCATGREADARVEFEHLAADDFKFIPRDLAWLATMVTIAEICAYLRDSDRAEILYRLLQPYASRNAVLDVRASYGPVAYYLGLLAATMSRFEEAEAWYKEALQMNLRMGARPWLAATQCAQAAMLLARNSASDRATAAELAGAALDAATALGMNGLAERASKLKATAKVSHGTARDFFVTPEGVGRSGRVLETILFLDIVDSTAQAGERGDRRWGELMREYYAEVRRQLASFGGWEVNTFGDDVLALFEAPAEAVRCACAVSDAMLAHGVKVRAGVHTGECEIADSKVSGIAVHIAARVVREAEPGTIVVSGTVRDLVVGADISFRDLGVRRLRGVPGEWRLFAVQPGAASRRAEAKRTGAEGAANREPAVNTFRCEGDFWTVAYGGEVSRLKDARGLAYIAHLLRHPGTELHVLDLTANTDLGKSADKGETAPAGAILGGTSDEQLAEAGLRRGLPDDTGEMLDAKAKAAYWRRLNELREALEDAKELGNLDRAEQIEDEMDAIGGELKRAIGLSGRDRRAASISERARLNVTRAIRAAIDRIAEKNADLGRHLGVAIKTGTFCSYTPDPGLPICWEF